MSKLDLIFKDSYLKLIANSAGSKMFQNYYARVGSSKKDILKGGDVSCAFFVTAVLKIFDMIGELHLTVDGALADMAGSGWHEIKKPKAGAILLWEEKKGHRHIGFFVGGDKAVSNRSSLKKPGFHHWTFGKTKKGEPVRKIEKIYWHEKLD